MTRSNTILAFVFLVSGTLFAQLASAQGGTYEPQRPTISPWMGLWQNNTGALDNYHTFVLPRQELNRQLQWQGALLARQEQGLQALNADLMQPQAGGMNATGQGSTFMNYSHFFNCKPSGLGARAIPARPGAASATSHLSTLSGIPQ